jgi:hypothetical protein
MVRSAIALFRSRENQAIVELAIRRQLAFYVHRHPRLGSRHWTELSGSSSPGSGASGEALSFWFGQRR